MACYRLVYDYESKRLSSFKKVSFSSGGRVARVCTSGGRVARVCTSGGRVARVCTSGGRVARVCTSGGRVARVCTSGGRVARVCTCFVLSVDVRSFLPWFVYVMSL